MATDPSVIAALEQAVAVAPENAALRKHLVTLLLDSDRAADALQHCVTLIAQTPDDAEALQLAGRAAEAAGDPRAASYARLANALAPASSETPSSETPGSETPGPETPGSETPGSAAPQPRDPAPTGDVVRLRVVGGTEASIHAEVEQSKVTLRDVAGMEAVKRRLELAFLGPMRNPELRRMYGKQLRGGMLLYGPPGCGKTFIAKAVAGELGARFISIGLPDVLNLWLGASERNVHDIFENARASTPCVLFFDEIDALGRKRSLMRESSERNVVNQLLAELDSVGSDNEGLFVLAATNHPWDVDSALRRPGRFDRTLLVLPPDREAREAILTSALAGRPTDAIDVAAIAAATERFSGADLVHLCESATEYAMEDSLRTGTARPITTDDLRRALREIQPSTRSWFTTARNYAEFANEGGMFDDLVDYLRKNKIR